MAFGCGVDHAAVHAEITHDLRQVVPVRDDLGAEQGAAPGPHAPAVFATPILAHDDVQVFAHIHAHEHGSGVLLLRSAGVELAVGKPAALRPVGLAQILGLEVHRLGDGDGLAVLQHPRQVAARREQAGQMVAAQSVAGPLRPPRGDGVDVERPPALPADERRPLGVDVVVPVQPLREPAGRAGQPAALLVRLQEEGIDPPFRLGRRGGDVEAGLLAGRLSFAGQGQDVRRHLVVLVQDDDVGVDAADLLGVRGPDRGRA